MKTEIVGINRFRTQQEGVTPMGMPFAQDKDMGVFYTLKPLDFESPNGNIILPEKYLPKGLGVGDIVYLGVKSLDSLNSEFIDV